MEVTDIPIESVHSEFFVLLKALFQVDFNGRSNKTKSVKSTPWFNQDCTRAKRSLIAALKSNEATSVRSNRLAYTKTLSLARLAWEKCVWADLL